MIYPPKEEFLKLADNYNMIPVFSEVAADMETPVSAYYKLCTSDNNPDYSFLLESVEGGENIARYSFLGAKPHSVFIQESNTASVFKNNVKVKEIAGSDVFDKIKSFLSIYKTAEILDFTPFAGGAVGYVSYDVINEIEPTVPTADCTDFSVPDAVFMLVDSFLIFDRVKQTIKVVSYAFIENDENKSLENIYEETVLKIKQQAEKLKVSVGVAPVNLGKVNKELKISSNKTKEEYCNIVEQTKQYILDGDIIQAVLSQRFSVDADISDLALYRALRMVNPSPYMFLLKCKDFSVVGASPEVHAKCTNREMVIRPIAGTRHRGKSPAEDKALSEELLDDPKERAEHIMLVDLARNDLGRIAKAGTVNVDQLMIVEKYSHVMHIVSNVKAELDDSLDSDSVMRATFPAGTVSGAPKVRAMQIIQELEKDNRGPYAGVVAYCSFNGNIDSCITIRTAVVKDNKVFIQAGAGIVADSVPEKEYEETVNKAGALMRAVKIAEQFEI